MLINAAGLEASRLNRCRVPMLQQAMRDRSFMVVRKGIIALLAFVLALHAGFGSGVAQTQAAIKIPCCGINCPAPLSASDRSCCQAETPNSAVEAISAKPKLPTVKPFAAFIHPRVVAFASAPSLARKSTLMDSPPGSTQLAILCSRQI
jgi:hypothetical protein